VKLKPDGKEVTMSKEKIDPAKVTVWIDDMQRRIVAKAWMDDRWHEVAFPVDAALNLAEMIKSLEDWDYDKNRPL
jgi:hypothetical protein